MWVSQHYSVVLIHLIHGSSDGNCGQLYKRNKTFFVYLINTPTVYDWKLKKYLY